MSNLWKPPASATLFSRLSVISLFYEIGCSLLHHSYVYIAIATAPPPRLCRFFYVLRMPPSNDRRFLGCGRRKINSGLPAFFKPDMITIKHRTVVPITTLSQINHCCSLCWSVMPCPAQWGKFEPSLGLSICHHVNSFRQFWRAGLQQATTT